MPILKIVAVCEKVIYDQDGPTSIISLFEAMKYQLQEAPLPERAILPNQWCVFTQWETIPAELGKPFTQIVRVFAPDGTLFAENEHSIVNVDSEQTQMRVRLQFGALPIWAPGKVEVHVLLKGDEEVKGTATFRIVYLPKMTVAVPAQPAMPQPE